MSIRDIFRQRSDSIESLQKKYRAIEGQKKSLEAKADELRSQSLRSDVDVSEQLESIQEEINLSEVALSETERDLEKMLEKKIASDFEGLNEQKLEYETRLNDLCRDAGKNTAKAVQSLTVLNLSFGNLLSKTIRESVISFSGDYRFKRQVPVFLEAYSQAINSQADPVNFRDWKKSIMKVEQLRPGSAEAGRHIAARVKQLISA